MKIYVNGDSHVAAAEAVNGHAFAEDDQQYFYLGRAPHPDNWRASWAKRLAECVQATLHTDAESASSNQCIRRTTRDWIAKNQRWLAETVMIIQWSTWEREEWWIDDRPYQVTASGIDDVPDHAKRRYQEWVLSVDWQDCAQREHEAIWSLHQELLLAGVRHLFVNGNNDFGQIASDQRHDWGAHYLDPYQPEGTYHAWLRRHGYHTVSPESWHFGADAHAAWAGFVLQYGITHQLWR